MELTRDQIIAVGIPLAFVFVFLVQVVHYRRSLKMVASTKETSAKATLASYRRSLLTCVHCGYARVQVQDAEFCSKCGKLARVKDPQGDPRYAPFRNGRGGMIQTKFRSVVFGPLGE